MHDSMYRIPTRITIFLSVLRFSVYPLTRIVLELKLHSRLYRTHEVHDVIESVFNLQEKPI